MTLLGYVKVTRPPLALLGVIASLSLLRWSGADTLKTVLVSLTIALGNIGWNMANELHDVQADAWKPWKPFTAKQVDPRIVRLVSNTLIFSSITMGGVILVKLYGIVYALSFLGHGFSFVYNMVRKDLAGNLAMSGAYGVAATLSLYPEHLFFVFGFMYLTLGFNLLTQWQDQPYEEKVKVKTAAMQLGDHGVSSLSVALCIGACYVFLVLPLGIAKLPFIATAIAVILGSSAVFLKKRGLVEVFCRYLARLMLILAFLTLSIFL